jgi:hypothetical protein
MKETDTIIANKEVDVSDCACEEEEEPLFYGPEDRFLLTDRHGSLGGSYETELPSFCSLSSLPDTT